MGLRRIITYELFWFVGVMWWQISIQLLTIYLKFWTVLITISSVDKDFFSTLKE